MKTLDLIAAKNKLQFDAAQVEGVRKFAPRNGYYLIRSIAFEPVGPTGQVLMAQTNWKPTLESYFIEDQVFPLAITRNLMFDSADHPPLIDDSDLIGKTLYIYNPVFDVKYFNGEPKQVIKALCHYIYEPARFINQANIISLSIPTIANKSIYQTLVDTAPYDLAEALCWEAEFGFIADAPVNEFIFDNETFDDLEESIVYDAPEVNATNTNNSQSN